MSKFIFPFFFFVSCARDSRNKSADDLNGGFLKLHKQLSASIKAESRGVQTHFASFSKKLQFIFSRVGKGPIISWVMLIFLGLFWIFLFPFFCEFQERKNNLSQLS